MFTFPSHAVKRFPSTFTGSLKDAGNSYPIGQFHPIGYRDLSRLNFESQYAGSQEGGKFAKDDRIVTDLDSLYNSVLENPYDLSARAALCDYLMDGGADPDKEVGIMAEALGMSVELSPYGKSQRWDGPGWIGRGPWGLWDWWAGCSGQFMQACRAGLFLDCPITTVIVCDLQPLRNRINYEWTLYDSAHAQTRAIQWDTGLRGLSVSECEQSLINDVIAAFLPEGMIHPYPGIIGAYRAFNSISALLAVSNAYVNLGRFAAGLPILSPIFDPPMSVGGYDSKWRYWATWIEAQWAKWRTHYRVDEWERSGDSTGGISYDVDRRRGPFPVYGRQWLRSMLPSLQPLN